jgi:Bacterial SH3 domain
MRTLADESTRAVGLARSGLWRRGTGEAPPLVLLAALLGHLAGCAKTSPAAEASASAAPAPPPAASSAAAPAAAPARFAVFGVRSDDVLNVRAEPDASSKKVYSFGPRVTTIQATGHTTKNGGTQWLEVTFEGGTGWVNRAYLSEMHPGGGCNDPNLTAAIRKFMRAVASSDGASLQEIVSPVHGLLVRAAPAAPSVTIPADEAGGLFGAATPKNWGTSGAPQEATFKALILPSLSDDVAGQGAKETCGKLVSGGDAELSWPGEFGEMTVVSFYRTAAPGKPWHASVGGLEYVDGHPYFAALVEYSASSAGAAPIASSPAGGSAAPSLPEPVAATKADPSHAGGGAEKKHKKGSK